MRTWLLFLSLVALLLGIFTGMAGVLIMPPPFVKFDQTIREHRILESLDQEKRTAYENARIVLQERVEMQLDASRSTVTPSFWSLTGLSVALAITAIAGVRKKK